MIFRGRTQRFSAWLACFAILLASLAPSISHALAAVDGSTSLFDEICTASGIKSVKPGDALKSKISSPAQNNLHFEHCPFCSSHANTTGLPLSVEFQLPVLIGHDLRPVLFYQSPRSLFIWAAAQSRAPPSL
jgi:hypothetical protein